MPRGASDIPILRLEVLQGFMTKFMSPPQFFLMDGQLNNANSGSLGFTQRTVGHFQYQEQEQLM